MNFEAFRSLAASRRRVRHFRKDSIQQEVIASLIDCARLAPSTYNLQPTHFYIVQEDAVKKEKLSKACMGIHQVEEAPLLVVFSGDRRVVGHHLEKVIDDEWESDTFSVEEEERQRLYIKMNFDEGRLGITWLAKLLASPIIRLCTPLPLLPAVHKRYWLTKEVMSAATHFLLAAESCGLGAMPIEIFDEWRVRSALNIPWSHIVPIIIAVGYPLEFYEAQKKLPFKDVVH